VCNQLLSKFGRCTLLPKHALTLPRTSPKRPSQATSRSPPEPSATRICTLVSWSHLLPTTLIYPSLHLLRRRHFGDWNPNRASSSSGITPLGYCNARPCLNPHHFCVAVLLSGSMWAWNAICVGHNFSFHSSRPFSRLLELRFPCRIENIALTPAELRQRIQRRISTT